VANIRGVRYLDDSKSTTPSSTVAALHGLDSGSAVLIAGGRNNGLDLDALRSCVDALKAVVAIGEAAPEVISAFGALRPVKAAGSMDEAVALAAGFSDWGDTVILSPACSSYDWYGSYALRGDDFKRCVQELSHGDVSTAADASAAEPARGADQAAGTATGSH
ncbi:MAG: glutamate ligase domain-containing protein, partial [Acidimicrobiales bacterium]